MRLDAFVLTAIAVPLNADPDPDYSPHAFQNLTPEETLGTALITAKGGTMTSIGKRRLLTPRRFAVHWEPKGKTERGACNWSTGQLVTWVGEQA